MARGDMADVPFEQQQEPPTSEIERKIDRMNKLDEERERREAEREARFQRQFALEQATKVTAAVLAANGTLEDTLAMADRFARWMETGQLSS